MAWLLLALWLPVTLHCGLEAAEILHSEDNGPAHGCCQGADVEHKDECTTVEGGSYRPEQGRTTVPTPVWVTLQGWPSGPPVQAALPTTAVDAGVEGDRDLDWGPVWHFVRRAAPSPRAPSVR